MEFFFQQMCKKDGRRIGNLKIVIGQRLRTKTDPQEKCNTTYKNYVQKQIAEEADKHSHDDKCTYDYIYIYVYICTYQHKNGSTHTNKQKIVRTKQRQSSYKQPKKAGWAYKLNVPYERKTIVSCEKTYLEAYTN